MLTDGDRIAEEVLSAFSRLPAKFKPRREKNGIAEWVPLAGIVLTSSERSAIPRR